MSKIEWTNKTWNPITGCFVASAGCTNCYAARFARRGVHEHHKGLTDRHWTGQVIGLSALDDAQTGFFEYVGHLLDALRRTWHIGVLVAGVP